MSIIGNRTVKGGVAGLGLLLVVLLIFFGTGRVGPQATLAQEGPESESPRGTGGGVMDPEEAAAQQQQVPVKLVSGRIFEGSVDHVAAGTGTRNAGYGNIRLRGTPSGSAVKQAFLYFGVICEVERLCPRTQDVNFDEHRVTGRLIATDSQPCWAGNDFGAYRAEVTHLIPPEINGDYEVDGLPSAVIDGSDPWEVPFGTELPMSEGATLLVIYENEALTAGVVYLHHGAVFFSGTVDITHALGASLPGVQRKFTSFGADGQAGFSTDDSSSFSDEQTWIGPNVGALVQIAGNLSAKNQNSDWNGNDGEPLNKLWDTHTQTVDDLIPVPGVPLEYVVRYVSSGDCMDVVGHVLTAR